jgi:hypothetical protein
MWQPLQTIRKLEQIAGLLLAPYTILDHIPRGEHPMEHVEGADLALLEQWGQRWDIYHAWTQPAGPTWRAICCTARHTVLVWHDDVGRKDVIDRLVHDLLASGMIDGFRWHQLVRQYTPSWLKKKDKEHYAVLL